MKKSLFIIAVFIVSLFTACAKPKANTSNATAASSAQPAAQAPAPLDPNIEKLNRVLMSMTDRCKEAIPNGDPNEFLADLEKVLSQWKGRYNSSLSISTGAASGRDHDHIESVIAEADKKMYEYKRNYYMTHGIDRRKR